MECVVPLRYHNCLGAFTITTRELFRIVNVMKSLELVLDICHALCVNCNRTSQDGPVSPPGSRPHHMGIATSTGASRLHVAYPSI